jgi:hypothetical protein
VQARGGFIKDGGCFWAEWSAGRGGEVGEALIELVLGAAEESEEIAGGVGHGSLDV